MSPFDKTLSDDFVKMQSKLDGMWNEVYSAPKEVTPINFAEFESKIKNKQAVAQLKAEYEAKSFKVVKTEYQTAEQAAAAVQKAEGEAVFLRDMATMMQNRIDSFKYASTIIPFMSLEEQIALTPGLDQEFDRQLSNYQQVTDANVVKALELDTAKIIADVEAGQLPEVPAEGVNKIMFTPVYFALLKEHADFAADVQKKYKITLPSAEGLINTSLKKQGALPTMEQINEHLETMELPFVLSAIQPPKSEMYPKYAF